MARLTEASTSIADSDPFGDPARQHNVAIENGARGIDNRIVLVIALGEYRIERRDRAAALQAVAGALTQLRQPREHRGRIALGRRGFADGQAISRCACANRVRESMISSTLLPRSLKYSATAVASQAPCRRISGGVSAGAATTTARCRSSGPRIRSTNSFTSGRVRRSGRRRSHRRWCSGHHAQQHALAHRCGEQADALRVPR